MPDDERPWTGSHDRTPDENLRALVRHLDPASVIACTDPDGSGYRYPACGQQRRREDVIIEALLDIWETDREAATAPQQVLADGGER